MKKRVWMGMAMTAATVLAANGAFAEASDATLETDEERLSYAIGVQVGQSIAGVDFDFDMDAFVHAIEDMLAEREPALSQEEVQTQLIEMQQRMQAQRQAEQEVEGAENRAVGEAYLAENAQRDGVQVTDSGLQYEVIEEGDGPRPSADSRVSVHYRGTLIDGTQFDSSHDRGEPATFGLNQVIPGWTEGLQLMPEGSTYKLYIPSDLAYGPSGRPSIPPNSVLVFEVELLEVL